MQFVTSLPTVHRYRKDMIVVGVNGRVVRDPSVTQAVVTAYHRIIPDGKFPACAVSLHVDPEKVDVNVHPAKTTVKLLDSRDIFSFVHHSIRDRLDEAGRDQGVQMRTESLSEPAQNTEYKRDESVKYDHQFAEVSYDIASEMEVAEYEHTNEASFISTPEIKDGESAVRVVGQLFNTVIVCEKDGEALFIDQHVCAHRGS